MKKFNMAKGFASWKGAVGNNVLDLDDGFLAQFRNEEVKMTLEEQTKKKLSKFYEEEVAGGDTFIYLFDKIETFILNLLKEEHERCAKIAEEIATTYIEHVIKAYVSREIIKAKIEEKKRCADISRNFSKAGAGIDKEFDAGVAFASNLIASVIMEE